MSEPRVFNVGDPEPPADVIHLRSNDGKPLMRVGKGWWYTRLDGNDVAPPADGEGWFWPPLVEDFPFTEVVSA